MMGMNWASVLWAKYFPPMCCSQVVLRVCLSACLWMCRGSEAFQWWGIGDQRFVVWCKYHVTAHFYQEILSPTFILCVHFKIKKYFLVGKKSQVTASKILITDLFTSALLRTRFMNPGVNGADLKQKSLRGSVKFYYKQTKAHIQCSSPKHTECVLEF